MAARVRFSCVRVSSSMPIEAMVRESFTRTERQIINQVRSPRKAQRWLESIPYNFEWRGDTVRTFRGVVRHRRAHCLEAALAAATILEQHGYPALLLDLDSADGLGHVVHLYRHKGKWGAVGRSRDPGLHGRRPVFARVRDLVYSYFDAFIDDTGRIVGYGVRDLTELDGTGVDWRLGAGNVHEVEDFLVRKPYQALKGSEARYRKWHARYRAFKSAHPDDSPRYFDNMDCWL